MNVIIFRHGILCIWECEVSKLSFIFKMSFFFSIRFFGFRSNSWSFGFPFLFQYDSRIDTFANETCARFTASLFWIYFFLVILLLLEIIIFSESPGKMDSEKPVRMPTFGSKLECDALLMKPSETVPESVNKVGNFVFKILSFEK